MRYDSQHEDAARELRRRLDALEAEVARLGSESVPSETYRIVQVFKETSLPTVGDRFYATHPANVSATDTEGSTATLSVDSSSTFYTRVLNGLASAGENLVAASVPFRWHAQRPGTPTPTVTPPGCPCAMPLTLYQWVSNPALNGGIFQNATITWQAVPSGLAGLSLGANAFLSNSTYVDALTGDTYRYYLHCSGSAYLLTRVYEWPNAYAIPGNPYRDLTRYSWFIGVPGNACTPFGLTNGQIYAGGTFVTIEITETNVHGI